MRGAAVRTGAMAMGLLAMAACERGAKDTARAARDAEVAVRAPIDAGAAALVDAAPRDVAIEQQWTLRRVDDEEPAIRGTMKRHASELRAACGADAGRAVVLLRLASNGKVLRATALEGDLAAGACFAREIPLRIPFFPPRGEDYEAALHVP